MDRNTITGLILIFAILIGYSIWNTPSEEEREAQKQRQDSIARVNWVKDSIDAVKRVEQARQDSIRRSGEINEVSAGQKGNNQPVEGNINRDKLGVFANSGTGSDNLYTIENELLKITVAAKGGKIISVELKDYQTYDSLPLIPFDPSSTSFGLTFFANNRIINTNDLYFRPDQYSGPKQISGEQSENLSMRLYVDASDSTFNKASYIEFLYTVKGDEYMIGFDINFVGMEPYIEKGTNYVDLNWKTDMLKLEKSVDRFNGPTIYYKFYEDEVDYLSETKDDEEELVTRIKWVSFKQRFFTSTLIANDYFLNANVKTWEKENPSPHYLRSMETQIGIPLADAGQTSIPMSMYFGPNKFKTLRQYKLDLERQIPLGWSFFLMAWINRYAVLPVFNFLEGFGWNYGIIILVLTILLKIVLFPIAYKSYKSSAKMRVLKPEIEEINQKFPKKEDAMKKQQAIMGLYKQAGVNPMAGCIPMLLQFPILIALFRFFPSAIELRQESFLWADDLSSYDSILDLGFNIPFYGDHVSLFTLLMTVSTLIYTKINQDMMGSSQQQMPGMKTMMYIMPIMFLGIFNGYAAGLSYYYFLANVITFAQMYLIRQTIDESKIRKQIEINKKKPKKKSKWQQRLEDAAKQRGYKP
ncbi:MAG: membrane protein insertase YidC, partial [Bacteroidales bacterium]|nr:membrane protein insertase YidC [Bacteroidales bacterium]